MTYSATRRDLVRKRVIVTGGGSGISAAFCRATAKGMGDIAVLVNNARNDERQNLGEVTPACWEDRIAIHQRPVFFATQAVLNQRKRLGGGPINLRSIIGRLKLSTGAVYSIAQAATHGLTRALARDFS